MVIISRSYREIKKTLAAAGVFSPDFEARQLIIEYLGADPFLSPEKEPDEEQSRALSAALDRRLAGEPLQYIIGRWEFCGLEFFVGEGVLIPRPETELIVEKAAEHLKSLGRSDALVLDLFSGTGCIPISIEKLTGARCFAVELYDKAFCYLKKNITSNSSQVRAVQADALDSALFPDMLFDIITANPPYLTAGEMDELSPEVRREPKTALYGGADGLDFYRRLIPLWAPRLSPGGALIVEVGDRQADDVARLMQDARLSPQVFSDPASLPRTVVAVRI